MPEIVGFRGRVGYPESNPAIKAEPNKQQILQALLDDRVDVVATDHAPHTIAEKDQPHWQAPAGLPLVQHSLNVMLEFVRQDKIPLERVVEETSHAVADCFEINERGYIREGTTPTWCWCP